MALPYIPYKEQLLDPRWQKKRLKILERDNWACTLCGDTKSTLHIHHESYCGAPWEVEDTDLKTHCEHCHSVATYISKTSVYKEMLLKKIVKIRTESADTFIVLVAVLFFEKRGIDIYVVYHINNVSKDITTEYVMTNAFLLELNEKLNG